MRNILLLLSLVASTSTMAQDKIISNTYTCTNNGCALTCLNFKNNWTTVSSKALKVTVNHYVNGNIEFLLNFNSESRGDEAIFISEKRLSCKVSGISN